MHVAPHDGSHQRPHTRMLVRQLTACEPMRRVVTRTTRPRVAPASMGALCCGWIECVQGWEMRWESDRMWSGSVEGWGCCNEWAVLHVPRSRASSRRQRSAKKPGKLGSSSHATASMRVAGAWEWVVVCVKERAHPWPPAVCSVCATHSDSSMRVNARGSAGVQGSKPCCPGVPASWWWFMRRVRA